MIGPELHALAREHMHVCLIRAARLIVREYKRAR
jgi:hypothetical protein